MCNGFGVIVTKDGRYLWIEPNSNGDVSHSDILRRAGIKDDDKLFTRAFVRVEIPTWKIGSFRFDEDSTLPGWVDEDAIKTYCNKLLKRVAPAWAEYEKVMAPALAEYEKVRDTALAEYEKVRDTALAEYKKVRDTAWAELIEKLSTIEGYLKA
jgi:hypothetical protein